jgi:hypothetical protein
MPLPPALTPEERHAALEKAAAARRERAEVKEKLKAGGLSLEQLLEQGDRNETIAKLKVVSALESMPGVGGPVRSTDASTGSSPQRSSSTSAMPGSSSSPSTSSTPNTGHLVARWRSTSPPGKMSSSRSM